MFEVEAIGVELGEAGCCDYDAGREFGLEDVEGEVEGFAEDLVGVRNWGLGNLSGRLRVLTVVRRLSGGLAKVTR